MFTPLSLCALVGLSAVSSSLAVKAAIVVEQTDPSDCPVFPSVPTGVNATISTDSAKLAMGRDGVFPTYTSDAVKADCAVLTEFDFVCAGGTCTASASIASESMTKTHSFDFQKLREVEVNSDGQVTQQLASYDVGNMYWSGIECTCDGQAISGAEGPGGPGGPDGPGGPGGDYPEPGPGGEFGKRAAHLSRRSLPESEYLFYDTPAPGGPPSGGLPSDEIVATCAGDLVCSKEAMVNGYENTPFLTFTFGAATGENLVGLSMNHFEVKVTVEGWTYASTTSVLMLDTELTGLAVGARDLLGEKPIGIGSATGANVTWGSSYSSINGVAADTALSHVNVTSSPTSDDDDAFAVSFGFGHDEYTSWRTALRLDVRRGYLTCTDDCDDAEDVPTPTDGADGEGENEGEDAGEGEGEEDGEGEGEGEDDGEGEDEAGEPAPGGAAVSDDCENSRCCSLSQDEIDNLVREDVCYCVHNDDEVYCEDNKKDCLAMDSMVATCDNGAVRLDTVQPGDWVLGMDVDSQATTCTQVMGVSHLTAMLSAYSHLYDIDVETGDRTNRISATAGHFVPTLEGDKVTMRIAASLKVGQAVRTWDATTGAEQVGYVTKVERRDAVDRVMNVITTSGTIVLREGDAFVPVSTYGKSTVSPSFEAAHYGMGVARALFEATRDLPYLKDTTHYALMLANFVHGPLERAAAAVHSSKASGLLTAFAVSL
uniref:Hedgehog protein Hint domain-containing protein n=1 Tax=Sexangularia sp. CB-2014 TaxID=1486929 RepID=A0A7S1VD23_9EUKA